MKAIKKIRCAGLLRAASWALVASFATALTLAPAVHAVEAYPTRPIRLVVPFAPGGGTDMMARLVGSRLSQSLGQSVVIENRPGAGTMLATELVARAPADGYTILVVSASHALNPSLYPKVNYDPLRDFQAVTLGTTFPFLLTVHPTVPARDLTELIALARQARHVELRVQRHRCHQPPRRRDVQAPGEGGLDPCAVQGRGSGSG